MSRDEEVKALLAQAKALEALGSAEDALEKATETYRKNPTEKNRNAYRKANEELVAVRSAARADRPEGPSVGGDAFVSGEDK